MTQAKPKPLGGSDPAPDEPESAVQLKRRHRLDPRLDEIAAAVKAGRLPLVEGLDQITHVMSELAGRVLRPEERVALEHVLRDAKSDALANQAKK